MERTKSEIGRKNSYTIPSARKIEGHQMETVYVRMRLTGW